MLRHTAAGSPPMPRGGGGGGCHGRGRRRRRGGLLPAPPRAGGRAEAAAQSANLEPRLEPRCSGASGGRRMATLVGRRRVRGAAGRSLLLCLCSCCCRTRRRQAWPRRPRDSAGRQQGPHACAEPGTRGLRAIRHSPASWWLLAACPRPRCLRPAPRRPGWAAYAILTCSLGPPRSGQVQPGTASRVPCRMCSAACWRDAGPVRKRLRGKQAGGGLVWHPGTAGESRARRLGPGSGP